jgi:hypothetical protein
MEGDKAGRKTFKAYPIGYFHIDIAEVRTEQGKLHMLVTIDRTAASGSGRADPVPCRFCFFGNSARAHWRYFSLRTHTR